MLEQQTTAERGATVVQFPEPADDIIPVISGIPLADLDSKVLARRMRRFTWKRRAQIFSNAAVESLENWGKISEIAPSKDHSEQFLGWAAVEMARRIGEVLDLLNEPMKGPDAALLYQISLKPEHHHAAGQWRLAQKDKPYSAASLFIESYGRATWNTLRILYWLSRDGASQQVWRSPPHPCPTEEWPVPEHLMDGDDSDSAA